MRGDDSRPHRYRHMLRGSVEGVIGGSFNNGNGRASIDEDEKAADDVRIYIYIVTLLYPPFLTFIIYVYIGFCSNDWASYYGSM